MSDPKKNITLLSGAKQDEPNWQNTVVCDWIGPQKDIEAIAIAIGKICNFNFIPSLIHFSDERAVFFYNSTDEAIITGDKGIIKTVDHCAAEQIPKNG